MAMTNTIYQEKLIYQTARGRPFLRRQCPVWLAAAVLIFGVQQIAVRGHRWNSALPEARTVLNDEWRRLNIDRATRVAFIVALIAQVPLGLLFAPLPPGRGVIAMAVATVALGSR
jgi:hypothetical protein